MSTTVIALYLVFVVSAIFLTVVILLQEGKGGGFGDALGTAGQQTFGVKASGIHKFTGTVAVIFLGSALLIHFLNRQAAGESVIDTPHLYGTRRIGPDLIRVAGKYSNDWHVAHMWDPRIVVPTSVMPKYPWFFQRDKDGNPVPNERGLAIVAYLQYLGSWIPEEERLP